MSNYKEELNNIHAPEDLILRTLNKVHEEEKKVEAETEQKIETTYNDSNVTRIKPKRIITTVSSIAAAAAVLIIALSAGGFFKGYSEESTSSSDMMMETTQASAESEASSASSNASSGASSASSNASSAASSASSDASSAASEASDSSDEEDNTMNYSYGDYKNKNKRDSVAQGEATNSLTAKWTMPDSIEVTSELNGLFNEGVEGLTKVTFEPAAYLGYIEETDLAHAFLCKTIEDTGKTFWSVVYIKEDSEGKVNLLDVQSIMLSESSDKGAVQFGTVSGDELVGNWSVDEESVSNGIGDISDDIKAAIDEALKSKVSVTYEPIMIMGSQVVSGTNYAVLCKNVTSSEWTIVYVYKNLDGKGNLMNVATFDLEVFE